MILENALVIQRKKPEIRNLKVGWSNKTINCKGMLLLPGFVNAHIHLASRLVIGRGLKLKKYDLFRKIIFKVHKKRTDEDVYNASLLACIESLRSGVTGVITMDTRPEPVISALEKTGVNYLASIPLKDRLDEAGVAEAQLKNFIKLRRKYGSKFVIGIANELETSPELMIKAFELAKKENAMVNMHACETMDEVKHMKKLTGMTTINYLNSIKALNNRLILAHCVHTTNQELKLLANNNVNLVHCPTSNMQSEGGVPNLKSWVRAGINFSLGTDEYPYNPSSSITSEALEALRHNKIKIKDLINAATNHGLFKDGSYVLIKLKNKPKTSNNALSSSLKGEVRTVIINDEIKVQNGELRLKLNEELIRNKVNQALKRVL